MRSDHDTGEVATRRDFIRLGAVLTATGVASASCKGTAGTGEPAAAPPTKEQNLEVWEKGKGTPYEIGELRMPGVCALPGPYRKHRFPDPDKYRGAVPVHGMCQLCSTVCGITGWVKDSRVIKVDGNPNDPNSRGKLCARGQAALNHL